MTETQSFLLYAAAVAGVSFTFNRVFKRKYPDRTNMFLVDTFLGMMVVTLLGFIFPELVGWVHFTIADYHDGSPGSR